MNLNTIKTAFGYLKTLLERATPLKLSQDSPEGVYNYLAISDKMATSGQPTQAQFEAIKAAGYETIINLLPEENENALDDEKALIGKLGLNYIYIPVDFKNPQQSEYDTFCRVVERTQSEKVWIHCAANMRVSAFLYRYRVEKLGLNEAAARQDMEKIWSPYGIWRTFIWPDASE